jgi:hypothetical protein
MNLSSLMQLAILGSFLLSPAAQAGDPLDDLLTTRSLSGDSKAWYGLYLNKIPVGIAAVATQSKDEAPGATEFDARILLRVGATPLVLQLSSTASGKGDDLKVQTSAVYSLRKDSFGERNAVWAISGQKVERKEPLVALSPLLFGTTSNEGSNSFSWDASSTFIGFKPAKISEPSARFFSPFSGEFFSSKDLLARFDDDGWANSFILPIPDAADIEFLRKTKVEAEELRAEIPKNAVDPRWVSSEHSLGKDVQKLKTTIEGCIKFGQAAEQEIKRKSPGVSYLLHRKLVNLANLCQRANLSISRWELERQPPEKFFTALAQDVKTLEKESRRELPLTLSTTPEVAVLSNGGAKWQNAKIVDYLVRKAHNEMFLLWSVDQERKNNIELRMAIPQLPQRSVLRATLHAKDTVLRTSMEFPSTKSVEDSRKKNNILDGKSFAHQQNPSDQITSVCKQALGAITLDLSNTESAVVRSDMIRGIWDNSTKTLLLSEFLNRLAAIPECTHSSVRIPKKFENETRNTIELFRHDVLQTENEFQVSNGRPVKLKLFPGTYEISVNSFVSGKLIGKREFTVEAPGKKSKSTITLNFR